VSKLKIIAIAEIIFGIVIISNFILIKKRSFIKHGITEQETHSQMKLSECIKSREKMLETWQIELNSNNVTIDSNISVENENYDKIKIQNIINGNSKLVFRITDNVSSCYDCKVKIFKHLKDLSKRIGLRKIVIIGRYRKMRDLIVTKEGENIPFYVYNYSEKLNIDADQYNKIDYLFVINNNLETNLTFVATNVTTEKIEKYFDKVNIWFTE